MMPDRSPQHEQQQHQQHPEPPRSRSSSLVFIQNRLRRLRSAPEKRELAELPVDVRGPLGLNLLHEPSEPCIDFIFIHGLGGGSRKTWSHAPGRGFFWPKEWLPSETGFKHARIHSYGYNSDWAGSKRSNLTVHDFGQAFLADMLNAPSLRKNGDTPIVIVAHSMGGLVAKKAYLLATRDPIYEGIARRVHSMYFLGTPHRGASACQLLKTYLTASVGAGEKAFIDQLLPGSEVLQTINEEFRHVCKNVKMWSFFEGQPTSVGLRSLIIVDRESAVIGLPDEHVQFLNADHRHVCKFESPADPNYITLQRCFLTTIDDIERGAIFRRQDEYKAQMSIVSSILEVDQRPEAELLLVTEKQQQGSCQWLTNHEKFQEWLDGPNELAPVSPGKKSMQNHCRRLFWLNGRPGTGKTVCAGHIVRYLDACNVDCSFYFFKHSDKEKSTVSELLRSLAFQMAASNFEVRQVLLAMAHGNERVSKDDHNMIWNSLFLGRLLRLDFSQPQVWVIDALDECSHKGLATLVQMLSKIDSRARLRIFVTSRPGGHVERLLRQDTAPVIEVPVEAENSLGDIELFIKTRWPHVENRLLVSEVLSKSNGIFLWASLIMTRMEEAYSIEDMEEVIRQVPSEMNDFYSRIVETLAISQSAEIAKCILKWVICSPRPLTTDEIKEIVRLDINRTLTTSDRQLEALCGHLIFVDKMARVQVLHQTISAYLTQDSRSEGVVSREGQSSTFRIARAEAHARAAELCLIQLAGKELSPPRTRRAPTPGTQPRVSLFLEYSRTYFAHHLARSSAALDSPLLLLSGFLRTNILSWIEITARTGSLSLLTKTAENLRAYLGRRAKYRPPLGSDVKLVEDWVNDLIHIAVAFGPNLLDSPSAIYFLVPLLCPLASIIHKQCAKPSKALKVLGSCEEDWDDRLSCFVYPTDALSVATCSQFLAVGLANGDIVLYDSENFEVTATLSHGQQVRHVAFGTLSSVLASCSPRRLKLWSKEHTCLWTANLDTIPLDLTFGSDDSELFLPNRESSVSVFSTADGSPAEELVLHSTSDSDSSDGENQAGNWVPPSLIRICPAQQLAALLYRSSTITIWDTERGEKLGIFEKDGCEDVYGAPQALDAVFNPVSELELLAIAYKDGDLVTCNPWTLEQVCLYEISVQVLAASPDGRTLATGDNLGVIHLFFFETLRPMYRITALEDRMMGIVFATDGLRFFDVRGGACNVWEPSVLVRRGAGSDDSSSEPLSEELPPQYVATASARMLEDARVIATTAQTARGDYLFCGRGDGTVDVVELATGVAVETLAHHAKGVSISHLEWNDEKSLLVSVDLSSRFIISNFSAAPGPKSRWERVGSQIDCRVSGTVSQVLVAPDGSRVLISTASEDELRDTANGCVLKSEPSPGPNRGWMTHPTEPSWLILSHSGSLHIYEWASLSRLTPAAGLSLLASNPGPLPPFCGTWFSRAGSPYLATLLGAPNDRRRQLVLVNASKIQLSETAIAVEALKGQLCGGMKLPLGFFKSSFFFLDMKGWVCSVGLKTGVDPKFYTRHFFIPRTWQFGSDLLIRVVSRSSVVFAHRDDLVVFHGLLDLEEKVLIGDGD
ncbi:hypothetical protein QBC33DRAFT_522616 [Phialemonium atrogriseum]|uniref:GPI inositol-deacylase n=1 Tax=Phialemonium atrogriseum TaxID=1093897 RepID=A0AAJ0C9W8_9PEZI|nr:uncharacterized protein QBC33DRAFT_522616 [Phialemonium atrogriseum]KAK1772835.1 hypothetical protein QBC33DRAFT_522616 [Phialemonium atrogriseum]